MENQFFHFTVFNSYLPSCDDSVTGERNESHCGKTIELNSDQGRR